MTTKSIVLETDIGGDYDDFVALNLCFTHPDLDLKGVLISPGYSDQIKLVQNILKYHNRKDIPIGTILNNLKKEKSCVGIRHFDALKQANVKIDDEDLSEVQEGWQLLEFLLKHNPELVYISISPMKNLGKWAKNSNSTITQSYSMGSYHGDPNLGQEILKSEFNFSGDKGASHFLMNTDRIKRKVFVSKNITHHSFYTITLHEQIKKVAETSKGHRLIFNLMEFWFQKGRHDKTKNIEIGKKMHDPLTCCVMVDESIVELLEVQAYAKNKKYGSYKKVGTNCFISYGNQNHIDLEKFYKILLTTGN